MKDLLVWVLCGFLVFAGVVLGHGFAVSDADFLRFIMLFDRDVLNALGGAVIAFFVSYFFYKKSGDDLKATAEKLRTATDWILRYQELKDNGAVVNLVKNEKGETVGLRQSLSVTESLTTQISDVSVYMGPPEDEKQ